MADRRAWSSRQQLLQLDRSGALLHLTLNLISIISIAITSWNTKQSNGVPVLLGMLVEAAALWVLFWSTRSSVYQKHRVACALVLQSIQFVANLFYIPLAFEICGPPKLVHGKYEAVAWSHFLSGYASFNIALHALCVQLPLSVAAPFAASKILFGWWIMSPSQTKWLSIPAVEAIALEVKSDVDAVYSSVLSALALAEIDTKTTSLRCPRLSLALWFHFCLAGLLPLYCLTIMQYSKQQPPSHTAVDSHQHQGFGAAVDSSQDVPPHTSLGLGHDTPTVLARSRSSRVTGAAASAPSEVAARVGALQQPSAGIVGSIQAQDVWVASTCSCMYHTAVLFGASMLIWVIVDVSVELWGPHC